MAKLETRELRFVRYADDCISLVKSEKAANRVLESITKYIEKKLGLKVNAEKSKVTRPTKTKYLGFSFWKDTKGKWKPKPHLKSYQKIKRNLKQLTCRRISISLDERIKKINYAVRGWVNYFRIANMKNAIQEIDEHLRTRIRVIIWKQWKKSKHRRECLIKLGVSSVIAKKYAYAGNRYWKMSHTPIIDKAISNKRLAQRGLICPIDQYNKVHILPIG